MAKDLKHREKFINDGFLPPPSLEEVPEQWLGGTIPYEVKLEDGNWRQYRSKFEDQCHQGVDKMDCVSESATNVIEEQINWLIKTDQIKTEPIKEWLDENGLFESSQRCLAKMSNTTKQGNSQMNVGDAIRKYGLLPEKDWITPKASEYMSWEEYYKEIPQNLKDKAKKILDYFSFSYERLNNYTISDLVKHKKQAPLWIATATCPGWGYMEIIPACSSTPCHATTFDCHEEKKWLGDLDHYNPYEKKLAWNYQIWYPYKLVVTPLPSIIKKKEEEGENMKLEIEVTKQKNSPDYLYADKREAGKWIRFGDEETYKSLCGKFPPEIEEKEFAKENIGSPVYLASSLWKLVTIFLAEFFNKLRSK